ncbi:MAG: hypothetical protein ACI4FV_11240 [Lachnospiraceae bacterium]
MIRKFLPVGQGAFYCECFDNLVAGESINIIYDCGSSSEIKNVENGCGRF